MGGAAATVPSRRGAGDHDTSTGESQVFSAETASRSPNVRMINWFEWDKYETEVQEHVDWTVLHDPATRAAFVGGLPGWLHFAEAPQPCRTAESGR
ncbi:hypothetical protein DEJ33_16735 [Curtobacterium sp. MCPF17_047]|nr:hypothetical protein DEJ33_16735 [Curtobacterium sp. MCPF17_047]